MRRGILIVMTWVTTLSLGVLTTGCGSTRNVAAKTSTQSLVLPTSTSNGGNSSGNNGSVGNGGSEDPRANLRPPYEFSVVGYGYEQVLTFTVQARDHLEVQFEPQAQTTPITGTNGYFPYSQLAVHFQIGSDTATRRATPLLSNGVVLTSQKSPVEDYTVYAQSHCGTATPLCTYQVKVMMPNYDAQCYYQGFCFPYFPTHTHVRSLLDSQSHTIGDVWQGTLRIGTDQTQELL